MNDAELNRKYGHILNRLPAHQRQGAWNEIRRMVAEQETPQRKTLSESYQHEEQPSFLDPGLQPQDWRKLADRRYAWPQDVDPWQAVHEMSSFLAFRILDQEAGAMGRRVQDILPDGLNSNI